jgi:hypothetical protein
MERFCVKKITIWRLSNNTKSKSQTDLLFWETWIISGDISRARRSVSANIETSAKMNVGNYGQTML